MTFEIEVNGHPHKVAIERAGSDGRFRVSIDGVSTLVDAHRVGDFGLSLIFPDASHESGEILLAAGAARGELLAHLSGRTVPVIINGTRSRSGGSETGIGARGEQKSSAPMPGRIVRVLVAAGDQVAARQPVIVVEAMKMENELRSPKAGRVKSIAVSAGASVEAGRVLVVVE